jgi:sugar transferase (PEP-CTERM system associated)
LAHVRIFKHYVRTPYLLLGLVEFFVLYFSMLVGVHLRFYDKTNLDSLGSLEVRCFAFAFFMLTSMISMGVYHARLQEGFSGTLLRTAVSFLLGAAALSMFFYMFPSLYIGRGVVAISAFFAFFAILFIRMIFRKVVDQAHLKRKVVVLGAGEKAQNLIDHLGLHFERSITLVGCIRTSDDDQSVVSSQFPMISLSPEGLLSFVEEKEIDEIVVAVDDRRKGFSSHALLDCKLRGIKVVDALTFFEREMGRIEVEMLHPSWLVFSDGFSYGNFSALLGRCFDIFVSGLLLLVSWPIMLATFIAIRLEDGWRAPIFYRQERVGLNGKTFYVSKFRSMRLDAEKAGPQWAKENDDRVTKVGRFIRQCRIDELPQIFNVFTGHMAFVGPRPERPQFVAQLEKNIPFYAERHRVKPGISGWAQLKYPYGSSEKDALEKLKYDLYYVKNQSLLLDIIIILQTVEVVLFGKGAR